MSRNRGEMDSMVRAMVHEGVTGVGVYLVAFIADVAVTLLASIVSMVAAAVIFLVTDLPLFWVIAGVIATSFISGISFVIRVERTGKKAARHLTDMALQTVDEWERSDE
jgi:ABC-type bacteriocin/lantibiotic exporter with double-glycine peptidase domain